MIPYGKQDITQQDIDAVVEVLKSDFLTQGPKVPAFEKALCDYTGAQYAVAVNSATSALHIACLALGLGKGDWLWTSPITFVASANCGLYCGAQVDFVDIDAQTYNLCPVALEKKLVEAKALGKLPKVVVPVHLCGQSCDMQAIHKLSSEYGFYIIEDASHAIGGKYHDKPIGNCAYSDITVFSFHPVKIITTAEGGVATTNNPELAHKMQLLRSHGITRDEALMSKAPDGDWYYEQIDLGFNYRMTELQAALGISQINRLGDFVSRRHFLADNYYKKLQNLSLILPFQNTSTHSSFHLFPVLIDEEKSNITRDSLFKFLKEREIGVNVHYIPVHTQPFYARMGFKKGEFPVAESYYARTVSLPLYYGMSDGQQDYVIEQLHELL
jgi:UDP-4-amino-4,6-dideoxy-N-acetyl-beta-L-altrosamine transaminase